MKFTFLHSRIWQEIISLQKRSGWLIMNKEGRTSEQPIEISVILGCRRGSCRSLQPHLLGEALVLVFHELQLCNNVLKVFFSGSACSTLLMNDFWRFWRPLSAEKILKPREIPRHQVVKDRHRILLMMMTIFSHPLQELLIEHLKNVLSYLSLQLLINDPYLYARKPLYVNPFEMQLRLQSRFLHIPQMAMNHILVKFALLVWVNFDYWNCQKKYNDSS